MTKVNYQVTEEKTVTIAPETQLAIIAFGALLKAEKKVEQRELELSYRLDFIPADALKAYAEITAEIEKGAK